MRFAKLYLVRFGCFTDKAVEFPPNGIDFHFVCGPNEAGKSTILSAISDMLFEIPHNSQYGFKHGYSEMQIGAIIENEGENLDLLRRKGRKDTLLDKNEKPVLENVLRPFLGGADRSFFERMFSLDHLRLRRGGQEILEAKGEVGQILFAAGSGVSGLTDELRNLENEADQLWGPRKRSGRQYYKALSALQEAESDLKNTLVSARDWKNSKAILDSSNSRHAEEKKLYKTKSAVREKLERVRRILPHLANVRSLQKEIKDLGEIPLFPVNASATLQSAETKKAQAEVRKLSLSEQIDNAQKEIDQIKVDELLLAREKDLRSLEEDRVVVQKNRNDIPKRQAEINLHSESMGVLLKEVGWSADDLESIGQALPSRELLAIVQDLVEKKGAVDTSLESTKKAASQADEILQSLKSQRDEIGEIPDSIALNAAIRFVREKGDLQSIYRRTKRASETAEQIIKEEIVQLKPWKGNENELRLLPLPTQETLNNFKGMFDDLIKLTEENKKDKKALAEKIEDLQLQHGQVIKHEHAVSEMELQKKREHRDKGWHLVRRKFVIGEKISPDEITVFGGIKNLVSQVEKAIKEADELADKRFESAKAVARLATIERELEQTQLKHKQKITSEREFDKKQNDLSEKWLNVWKHCNIDPSSPGEMFEWMKKRGSLLQIIAEKKENDEAMVDATNQTKEAKDVLLESLSEMGLDKKSKANKTLELLTEEADALKSELAISASAKAEIIRQIKIAKSTLEKAQGEERKAQVATREWKKSWERALISIKLNPQDSIQVSQAKIQSIKEIADLSRKINSIQKERIDVMKRDITAFESAVNKLIKEITPDLQDLDPSKAVLQLNGKVQSEAKKETQRELLKKTVDQLNMDLNIANEEIDSAIASIKPLFDTAGSKEIEDLRTQVSKFENLCSLEKQLSSNLETLLKEGDGKSLEELSDECKEADPDNTKAEIDSLSSEISEINERLQILSTEKATAQTQLDKISGRAEAAMAAAKKQQALAEMREAAEQYTKVKTAATLLRWAIENYRKEKQAPLLKRAGVIFQTITLGEFKELRVDFDDEDQAHLAAVRSNDIHVGVDGMSDGTVDQLYLSLRVAAIEEYLDKAIPLPFIADDLFINFDNERAAAGFKVLAELAKKTQVLFFSHHKHLAKIAQDVFQKPPLKPITLR